MTTDRLMLRQFICFASVGAVATALQYGILIVAIEWLRIGAVLASCTGFVISAVFNYWLNYHLTFRSRKSHLVAASRFALVSSGGLALNGGIMLLLVDSLHWPYLPAQIMTTVPVLSWNFFCNRMWSFAAAADAPREALAEER
jgi:putative flippase GtrA